MSGWYRTPATPHGASCGIYLWATAHGIDIKASSPLRRCDCVTGASEGLPEAGAVVVDTRTGRVGEVIAYEGERRVVLRPPAGGGEWEADADVVRDATDAELLSAKVRFANAMSRWGQWAHLHDHG
ncbi:hypothetical protein [Streptomyces sp. UNOC14_S4]|uniref:hypothetical protein n=1 Tax=Streptomyces sp. UNOC14_S4 TaxID=2872340 RepID=UPI0035AFE66F